MYRPDALVDSPQIIPPADATEPPVVALPTAQSATEQPPAPATEAIQVAAPDIPVLEMESDDARPGVIDIDLAVGPAETQELATPAKPRWWRRGRKDAESEEETLDEARTETLPEVAEQVPLPPAAGGAPTPSEERASGGEKRSIIESVDSLADLEAAAAAAAELLERLRQEEAARVQAEEAARLKAEEEARIKAEEEERARAEAEEEARLAAEEEARLLAEEEARVKAQEAARLKAQEAARLKAEEEARLKAEEEARIKAEEARIKAEEEARIKAEAEERARRAEEEDARAREKALVTAAREAKLRAREEARLRAEEQARADEEARLRIEAEQAAAKAAEEARLRAEEQARNRAEQAAKLRADEEALAQARAEEQSGDDALRASLMQEMLGLGAQRGVLKMAGAAATGADMGAPAWPDPAPPASAEVTFAARPIPSPQPQQDEKKRSKLPWKKSKRKRGETEASGRPAAVPVGTSTAPRLPVAASSNGAVYEVPRMGDPALAGPGAVFLVCSRCGQPSPGGGLCEACEDALSQLRQLTAALLEGGD
jgi:hypothetical protein